MRMTHDDTSLHSCESGEKGCLGCRKSENRTGGGRYARELFELFFCKILDYLIFFSIFAILKFLLVVI